MTRNGRHWLFDLDNTIYPLSSGLFSLIDERINMYLAEFCGFDARQADFTRRDYFSRYGLTLLGLMDEHGTDPSHYLEYVHRVPVNDILRPNSELRRILSSIDSPKSIFTNGSQKHSLTVLGALGLEDLFGDIFDITTGDYIPKPDQRAYRRVLDALGADAGSSVLVEDLRQNLPPAKALGMTTILVGESGDVESADYVVGTIEEIEGILPALDG